MLHPLEGADGNASPFDRDLHLAVVNACAILNERLSLARSAMGSSPSWLELLDYCYTNGIDLSAKVRLPSSLHCFYHSTLLLLSLSLFLTNIDTGMGEPLTAIGALCVQLVWYCH